MCESLDLSALPPGMLYAAHVLRDELADTWGPTPAEREWLAKAVAGEMRRIAEHLQSTRGGFAGLPHDAWFQDTLDWYVANE